MSWSLCLHVYTLPHHYISTLYLESWRKWNWRVYRLSPGKGAVLALIRVYVHGHKWVSSLLILARTARIEMNFEKVRKHIPVQDYELYYCHWCNRYRCSSCGRYCCYYRHNYGWDGEGLKLSENWREAGRGLLCSFSCFSLWQHPNATAWAAIAIVVPQIERSQMAVIKPISKYLLRQITTGANREMYRSEF